MLLPLFLGNIMLADDSLENYIQYDIEWMGGVLQELNNNDAEFKQQMYAMRKHLKNNHLDRINRSQIIDTVKKYKADFNIVKELANEHYENTGCTDKSSNRSCRLLAQKLTQLNVKIAEAMRELNDLEDAVKEKRI